MTLYLEFKIIPSEEQPGRFYCNGLLAFTKRIVYFDRRILFTYERTKIRRVPENITA